MSLVKFRLSLVALAMLPYVSAHAEDTSVGTQEPPSHGLYVVARGGGAFDSEAKFKASAVSALPLDDTTKYKIAPFGEVGAGYRFRTFRVEETIGYSSSNSKTSDLPGHARTYSLIISGFADIPVNDVVVPYLGGGLGAVMVDAKETWVDPLSNTGMTLGSKTWGPLWHLDAGVGLRVTPRVTVELGGRYEQTFNMRKRGTNGSDIVAPLSQYHSMIGMVGVRYAF